MESNEIKKVKIPGYMIAIMIISIVLFAIGVILFASSIISWYNNVDWDLFVNMFARLRSTTSGTISSFAYGLAFSGMVLTCVENKKSRSVSLLVIFSIFTLLSLIVSALGFWFGSL